jgi:hypothetical protein
LGRHRRQAHYENWWYSVCFCGDTNAEVLRQTTPTSAKYALAGDPGTAQDDDEKQSNATVTRYFNVFSKNFAAAS